MNGAQLHLALNHFPVVATVLSLPFLFLGLRKKAGPAVLVGLWLLVSAGATAVPAFFSGEGAEEVVEPLAIASEQTVESHEDAAKAALGASILAGLLAVAVMFARSAGALVTRKLLGVTAAVAVVSTGLVLQAAHLGGLIHHDEIQANAAATSVPTPGETEDQGAEHED
jgi:hypothetical protein